MNRTLQELSDRVLTRENAWTALTLVAAVAGATTARSLLKSGWRSATGQEPPDNPDAEDSTWREAMAWAVVTGAIAGVARSLSRGGASKARRRWA